MTNLTRLLSDFLVLFVAFEVCGKEEEKNLYAFSSGTGFITASGNANIITNNHVIDGCDTVVISHKGNRIESRVLAVDAKNDLAILKAKIILQKFIL